MSANTEIFRVLVVSLPSEISWSPFSSRSRTTFVRRDCSNLLSRARDLPLEFLRFALKNSRGFRFGNDSNTSRK